jgi:hypothetical protein
MSGTLFGRVVNVAASTVPPS